MDKTMSESISLRVKAVNLRHLADFTNDQETEQELLKLATEYEAEAEAAEIEAQAVRTPTDRC